MDKSKQKQKRKGYVYIVDYSSSICMEFEQYIYVSHYSIRYKSQFRLAFCENLDSIYRRAAVYKFDYCTYQVQLRLSQRLLFLLPTAETNVFSFATNLRLSLHSVRSVGPIEMQCKCK